MSKEFWKSKIFWTQLLGFVSATLVAVLPIDYKPIIETGVVFLTSILTIAFRWTQPENPLGFGKK